MPLRRLPHGAALLGAVPARELPSVTFVSSRHEASIVGAMAAAPRVRSLDDLRLHLDAMQDAPSGLERSLDLRGHSTGGGRLLRLGESVIDMTVPEVDAFFRRLAADAVLRRLGFVQLRLLGCGTACEPPGRLTIRLLAHVLGVPVYGTLKRLQRGHYGTTGFDPTFAHLLVAAHQLPHSRLPPLED
jgi:hypothetical protein